MTRELERESMMRDRPELEKHVAHPEATLALEREKKKQKGKKTLFFFKKNSLILSKKQDKVADLERESMMRDRPQLEKCTVQLESSLDLEQEQQEQKKEKIKQDMKKRNTALTQNITELQNSLKLSKEQVKVADFKRESLMTDRQQLGKHVVHPEATLALEREKKKKTFFFFKKNFLILSEKQEKVADLERESMKKDRQQVEKYFAHPVTTLALERVKKKQKKKTFLFFKRNSLVLNGKRDKVADPEKETMMRDRPQLEKCVVQLESSLFLEQKQQKQKKEKIKQDMEERNIALTQNITELQNSLKLTKEQEKVADLERKSLMRDRQQLGKHVDKLGAILVFKREKKEQKKKKALFIFKNHPLVLRVKKKKVADLERESMIRDRQQLEKHVKQLEASLVFEREKKKQKKHKALSLFKKHTLVLRRREKVADLKRERKMRDREQLKKHVAKLEASLVFEREKFMHKKEKIKRDMEEKTTAFLLTINKLRASLVLWEEREMTEKLKKESLMEERELLEKHVAELEATLVFEREQNEQEKKKMKHDMEERTTALHQKINKLQDSLNLWDEWEMTEELEKEKLRRDRELLENQVAQLEATLASLQKQREQKKKKMSNTEERDTVLLQTVTELQNSLKLCVEQGQLVDLEKEILKKNNRHLEKLVAQLEAPLTLEQEKQKQKKGKHFS